MDETLAPARLTLEARWFAPCNVSTPDVPDRPPDTVREDWYHAPTLTRRSAWKRRGRGTWFEYKARIGPPATTVVGGVPGSLEAWIKVRTRRAPPLAGTWIPVRKQKWRAANTELCIVTVGPATLGPVTAAPVTPTPATVGAGTWWSIAVDGTDPGHDDEFAPWWRVLRTRSRAASFPAWLLSELDLPDR